MPIEIIIPRLGWSMEEGNFVNWLKKDGEVVKSGEPLFSLENDKAEPESSTSPDERNLQTESKPSISPRARRLAAELGIDPARLRGSGPAGRVTEKDVRDAAQNQ